MTAAVRLRGYLEDVLSLPRDCRLAWRHGGAAEVLITLLERSLYRVCWGGRYLVVRAPLTTAAPAAPAGVSVGVLAHADIAELDAVASTPRRRLFRRLVRLGGTCVVARRDGRIIGYVWGLQAGPLAESRFLRSLPPGMPLVRSLFVTRSERGRGVATAMLAALGDTDAAAQARATAPACCALVRAGNRASLRTIESISGGHAEIIGRVVQLKLFRWVLGRFVPLPAAA